MATHSSILAGRSHGQRSLVGYSPWGCKRAGHSLATKPQQQSCFRNRHAAASSSAIFLFELWAGLGSKVDPTLPPAQTHCTQSGQRWGQDALLRAKPPKRWLLTPLAVPWLTQILKLHFHSAQFVFQGGSGSLCKWCPRRPLLFAPDLIAFGSIFRPCTR